MRNFERHAPAEAAADAVDQVAQERGGLLGVVHVAWAILEPQDVAGLGDVREQRVVAAVFPMVGIEAAEGPGDRGAGAHDGAVDIEGEPRDVQAGHRVEHDVLVQPDQRAQRILGEASQPIAHRARGRHAGQAGEPAHQRIPDEVLQVLQSPRADVGQRQEQQGETRATIVSPESGAGRVQPAGQINLPQVAAHQLEPAVRRELLRDERDGQISLDHLPQRAYAQAHQRGLHESREGMGISTLLIRGIAPLMHFSHAFPLSAFSDWG